MSDLKLLLKLDEGTGTALADASGNGYDGAASGDTSWREGVDGKALSFGGTNGKVTVSGFTQASTPASFTVSFWVRCNTVSAPHNAFIIRPAGSGAYWCININDGNKIILYIYDGVSSSQAEVTLTKPQRFNHVVAMFESGTSLKIYVDNTLKANAATSIVGVGASTRVITLGNVGWQASGNNYYFNGALFDVRIYSRLLSAAEIAELYNIHRNPVLFLRMDTADGYTLPDASGKGNDGELNGATLTTGKYGNGVNFDGVDNYVNVGYDASLDAFDEFTLAFWMYPTSAGGAYYRHVIDKGWQNSGSFLVYFNNVTSPFLYFTTRDTTQRSSNVVLPSLERWYHVVCVFKRGEPNKIYVNATKGANSSNTNDTTLTCNAAIKLGGESNDFQGVLDEVRLYRYAWTPQEIATDYKYGIRKKLVITDVNGVEHVLPTSRCEVDLNNGAASTVNFSLNDTNNHVGLLTAPLFACMRMRRRQQLSCVLRGKLRADLLFSIARTKLFFPLLHANFSILTL
jgi:hypothetical protein